MKRSRRRCPPRIVCIDKPSGPTSFDVVRKVRAVTGCRRVGHGGTLDPLATGLLIVGLGAATRLLRFLADAPKTYRARVVFGVGTDTDDGQGTVVEEAPVRFDEAELRAALARFTGEFDQVPPAVSAVHVEGRRAYDWHHRGESPPVLAARRVYVHRLELLVFAPPAADLLIECGPGTYVRSLARDLGQELRCPAHVAALRRERVGQLCLEDAVPIDAFAAAGSDLEGPGVLKPAEALRGWPRLVLSPSRALSVRHGAQPDPSWLAGDELASPPPRLALLDGGGELVAIAEGRGSHLRLALVLPESEHGDLQGFR